MISGVDPATCGRCPRRKETAMPLQLYNTLTRTKEIFEPADPSRVTMYVCGPTVYNYPHIGNARPAVVFDILYRLLEHEYDGVVYARNITDVDDKINAAAQEQGVPISEIAQRFETIYREDMEALGVRQPDIEPHATDHVQAMIDVIQRLIDKGHAYEVEGHVLFHVPSFDGYGQLSRRDREDMVAGARVEVAPYKKDPADFVLWKPSTPELPGWDSPWGRGRPGWHLECSTMIECHLGETIDIHGGGQDLIFPHHENEIAQAVCSHEGVPYVRYWVHNGFLNVDHEKMSKSLGNVRLVRELLQEYPGEAIRLALIAAQYRKPLDWTHEGVVQARRTLDRLYRAMEQLQDLPEPDQEDRQPSPELLAALEDDLNTPRAIAELLQLSKEAQRAGSDADRMRVKGRLSAGAGLLGLLQQSPESWFAARREADVDADEIESLISQRAEARKNKDFATADRIRDELAERGIVLEDRAEGTIWRVED
jgi:cysteinyl-tRNA synthetase